jgi:hypothetical protein
VYAISVGLARQWSRYLKRHPDVAPPWFVAAGSDPGHAFAAFVGSDAATSARVARRRRRGRRRWIGAG